MIAPNRQREGLPVSRRDDLVVSTTGPEVLVFDQRKDHLHHLNPIASAVWHLCDGQREVAELAADASDLVGETIGRPAVLLALGQLEEANLLDAPLDASLRSTRQSRRTLLRKAGLAGAVAVPAIVSISAPAAAQINSDCVPGGACIAGRCCQTGGYIGCCVIDNDDDLVCSFALNPPCD